MPSKLNKNAQKLVNALESGNYAQCIGKLCKKEEGRRIRYCCLGVACRLYQKEHPNFKSKKITTTYSDLNYIAFGNESDSMPQEVQEWYGFSSGLGNFTYRDGEYFSLALLNDTKKKTFKEIAKVIRSKPKGLFKRKVSTKTNKIDAPVVLEGVVTNV